MPDASDIHGTVFKNGSATLLARVVGADGVAITQATLSEAKYTVYELDEHDPDIATPIDGHDEVPVVIADTIFDALQQDALWDVDDTGYNFKHVLDVSSDQAFATAGTAYRVVVELTPTAGQVILVRFRVHAI
jgi:hypothetical protein